MKNQWLQLNQKKIDDMQYNLTELAYKNENPGVPLAQYRGLIGASVLEIKKLQTEIDRLNDELKKKE
jgi:hypothetical protein